MATDVRDPAARRLDTSSTARRKRLDSSELVPTSSRKTSSSSTLESLTIEAVYVARTGQDPCAARDDLPDECERARLIGDITRLIREPLMPEATRTAGLTLIGWLARRMPGEAPHALGVLEAQRSERRLLAASPAAPDGEPPPASSSRKTR